LLSCNIRAFEISRYKIHTEEVRKEGIEGSEKKKEYTNKYKYSQTH